jgi:hypothetical protein
VGDGRSSAHQVVLIRITPGSISKSGTLMHDESWRRLEEWF